MESSKLIQPLQVEVDSPPAPTSTWARLKHKWSRTLHLPTGWRLNVLLGAVACAVVLIANLVLLIAAQVAHKSSTSSDILVLYRGSCAYSSRASQGAHVAINVMSSILLAASTCCVQVLLAPSRGDIDSAHASRTWLHIGVSSLRNFRRLGFKPLALSALLLCSSLPLHLFYNSAIYQGIDVNDTMALLVFPDFLKGAPWTSTVGKNIYETDDTDLDPVIETLQREAESSSLVMMDNRDCFSNFTQLIINDYRNVLLVAKSPTEPTNGSIITPIITQGASVTVPCYLGGMLDSNGNCDVDKNDLNSVWEHSVPAESDLSQLHNRTNYGATIYSIQYCLAEKVDESCTVNLSRSLLLIVIVCNLIKLICLAATLAVLGPQHSPLVTFGDAVASFLVRPDANTCRCGTVSHLDLSRARPRRGVEQTHILGYEESRPTLTPRRLAWHPWTANAYKIPGRIPWILSSTMAMCLFGLLCYWCFNPSENPYWTTFGAQPLLTLHLYTDSSQEGPMSSQLLSMALKANAAQLVLSIVYAYYNNVLTSVVVARESLTFATKRQPLRVTAPHGDQYSSHFLSLPLKAAVPIIACFAVLHWLISESVFFLNFLSYSVDGTLQSGRDTVNLGVSKLSCIISMAVLVVGFIGFSEVAVRRVEANMPLLGSNSLAISAACQPASYEDEDMATRPLMYGVLKERGPGGLLRVGFSAGPVEPLAEEAYYE